MGNDRDYRRSQRRASAQAQETSGRRIHTSPDAEGAKELDYWQPERLTLKAGIQSLSWIMRLCYLLILLGTAGLNLYAAPRLPEELSLLHWFGYSSFTVNSIIYLIFTFCLILFLVYRDIINRSVSRRKIFIPLIFCLGNYYIIADQLLISVG